MTAPSSKPGNVTFAEKIQRENLSAIESVDAIVEIIDAHLIEDTEYAEMGNDPVNRVNTLLGKLNSVVNNQNKQSTISKSQLQQVHIIVMSTHSNFWVIILY